jgi:hypothetical protein
MCRAAFVPLQLILAAHIIRLAAGMLGYFSSSADPPDETAGVGRGGVLGRGGGCGMMWTVEAYTRRSWWKP